MESWTCNPKVVGSSLRSGRDCRWGEWITSTLSTLNTTTEVKPLSKAPNPQLLSGRHSIGCPLLQVYVHYCVCTLGWVKCRAQIPSMGHHTWPHTTSLSVSFPLLIHTYYINTHIWKHVLHTHTHTLKHTIGYKHLQYTHRSRHIMKSWHFYTTLYFCWSDSILCFCPSVGMF